MRDARLGINRQALHHNLRCVRAAAPYARALVMVKADAYGHGACAVAQTLREADGFGVAFLEEALALRKAGITQPITVLEGVFSSAEMFTAVRQGLTVVVHHAAQIELLEQCRLSGPVNVWLKIDTGMHRLGFAPASAPAAYQRLRAIALVGELGLLTHFASADNLSSPQTEQQVQRFTQIQQRIATQTNIATQANAASAPAADTPPISMANSAAILAWPHTHGAWVRPGIMLYGSSPFADRTADELGLRPVMTLRSRLIAVQTVEQGEPVGYGGTWQADKTTRIGVIAIGYGDGYPRHARNGTPVLVGGHRVTLAGRVSMDMITVDLGTAPVELGAECILWGEGLSADIVAAHADTISYELFCQITPRVHRDIW